MSEKKGYLHHQKSSSHSRPIKALTQPRLLSIHSSTHTMSSSQDMTLNLQHTSLFEEEEETSFLDMSSSFDESRRLHEEEGLMIYHINEALGYEDRSADLLPSNWDWEGLKESLLPYLNQEEESSVDFDMDNDEELLSEEELFEILLLVSKK